MSIRHFYTEAIKYMESKGRNMDGMSVDEVINAVLGDEDLPDDIIQLAIESKILAD